MTTTEQATATVDWDRIADRLQQVMADMIHKENYHGGAGFYAEALRRTLGHDVAFGRDIIRRGEGLTTEADAKHTYDNGALERMQREQAEEKVKEARAETRRAYAEAGQDFADFLRAKCNERSVPSKYRRDGVAWAADQIDPRVPKDQFGNVRAGGEDR
jgi:hypothetical protein